LDETTFEGEFAHHRPHHRVEERRQKIEPKGGDIFGGMSPHYTPYLLTAE
jgi:hypothetical protein